MSNHQLEIVSCIAKALKAACPGIPMGLATRYAKKILKELWDAGYID
jgi:hypothetical protein